MVRLHRKNSLGGFCISGVGGFPYSSLSLLGFGHTDEQTRRRTGVLEHMKGNAVQGYVHLIQTSMLNNSFSLFQISLSLSISYSTCTTVSAYRQRNGGASKNRET
jgi:hypothetical protein